MSKEAEKLVLCSRCRFSHAVSLGPDCAHPRLIKTIWTAWGPRKEQKYCDCSDVNKNYDCPHFLPDRPGLIGNNWTLRFVRLLFRKALRR